MVPIRKQLPVDHRPVVVKGCCCRTRLAEAVLEPLHVLWCDGRLVADTHGTLHKHPVQHIAVAHGQALLRQVGSLGRWDAAQQGRASATCRVDRLGSRGDGPLLLAWQRLQYLRLCLSQPEVCCAVTNPLKHPARARLQQGQSHDHAPTYSQHTRTYTHTNQHKQTHLEAHDV